MFFEDEKDIIREGADIHIDEDGTVTWEDVLNTDDELPVLDDTSENIATQDLGDELELVQTDEEVDEQELMKILSNSKETSNSNVQQKPKIEQEEKPQEDFDIDSQLANVVLEENKNNKEENFTPRKQEKKQSGSTSPLLIAVLFACLIAAGVYYGGQFLQNNESLNRVSKEDIPAKPSVQQDMNNVTQEDIEQRRLENEEKIAQEPQEAIPVVNEEQVNEIKPTQEEKKEKKQVIKVVPTGRSNPFMPITKYATTTIPDANISYDDSGIPKPPEEYGEKTQETVQLMSIAVSGIMYDDVKPSAIITFDNNDYFVQKGDKLDNYKIIDISKNFVKIALGNNIYRATIGEEFKISDKFSGNAQFIPEKQGGGRQYYSISDETRSSRSEQRLRYVSEDEIKINTRY